MIGNIYSFISAFLSAIGFDALLLEVFPRADTISSVSSYDFMFFVACAILSFFALSFVLRLFVGILRKFVEVISND